MAGPSNRPESGHLALYRIGLYPPSTGCPHSCVSEGGRADMEENIFESMMVESSLFLDKSRLHHTYVPEQLPHRDKEISTIAHNLVEALHGQIPSNMILYGVTGAGKTAVTSFVLTHLQEKGDNIDAKVGTYVINCRNIDTNYRVLALLGNELIDDEDEKIPFTGWPTDRVFDVLMRRMEDEGGVHVVVLDEIDYLIKKSGDDLLYNLTSLNGMLRNARLSVIGITNDLTFTEYLDARVRSRLGQEDLVFSPYTASQLQDILNQRVDALVPGSVSDGVVNLCAAMAAREHGDARRALDLLRASAEEAHRVGEEKITPHHVRLANNRLERDQMTLVIGDLPLHQKLVLFAIYAHHRRGVKRITTGEVYQVYKQACRHSNSLPLTARRITDLISTLDMLGMITAQTVSRGRYGRSKEIALSIPSSIDIEQIMVEAEAMMQNVVNATYSIQSTLI